MPDYFHDLRAQVLLVVACAGFHTAVAVVILASYDYVLSFAPRRPLPVLLDISLYGRLLLGFLLVFTVMLLGSIRASKTKVLGPIIRFCAMQYTFSLSRQQHLDPSSSSELTATLRQCDGLYAQALRFLPVNIARSNRRIVHALATRLGAKTRKPSHLRRISKLRSRWQTKFQSATRRRLDTLEDVERDLRRIRIRAIRTYRKNRLGHWLTVAEKKEFERGDMLSHFGACLEDVRLFEHRKNDKSWPMLGVNSQINEQQLIEDIYGLTIAQIRRFSQFEHLIDLTNH